MPNFLFPAYLSSLLHRAPSLYKQPDRDPSRLFAALRPVIGCFSPSILHSHPLFEPFGPRDLRSPLKSSGISAAFVRQAPYCRIEISRGSLLQMIHAVL
jgi:hypothetical protein